MVSFHQNHKTKVIEEVALQSQYLGDFCTQTGNLETCKLEAEGSSHETPKYTLVATCLKSLSETQKS